MGGGEAQKGRKAQSGLSNRATEKYTAFIVPSLCAQLTAHKNLAPV